MMMMMSKMAVTFMVIMTAIPDHDDDVDSGQRLFRRWYSDGGGFSLVIAIQGLQGILGSIMEGLCAQNPNPSYVVLP